MILGNFNLVEFSAAISETGLLAGFKKIINGSVRKLDVCSTFWMIYSFSENNNNEIKVDDNSFMQLIQSRLHSSRLATTESFFVTYLLLKYHPWGYQVNLG